MEVRVALALSSPVLIGFRTTMGPLEFIYYIGYSFKKSYSLKHQKRLPRKVISVGNITVGGTGKTPAVIAIAEEAKKHGYQPCILTRGYKGKASGPCFISKGAEPLIGVDEAGDEPLLMAERLKGVPIIKCADRYEGGVFALSELSSQPSLFILDDGFQHWRLHRDIDILLIDSTNPFGNNKLLPAGILREPLKEIKRSDIIVITRANSSLAAGQVSETDVLVKAIRQYNPDATIFLAEHKPVYAKTLSGKKLPLDVLSGRGVICFCGIGNPDSLKNTVLNLNVELKDFVAFKDHYRYEKKDISKINETAKEYKTDWIVTTEKDIMRLKNFSLPENLVSLIIEFSIDKDFYEKVFMEG